MTFQLQKGLVRILNDKCYLDFKILGIRYCYCLLTGPKEEMNGGCSFSFFGKFMHAHFVLCSVFLCVMKCRINLKFVN